jgi:hypothetical protein
MHKLTSEITGRLQRVVQLEVRLVPFFRSRTEASVGRCGPRCGREAAQLDANRNDNHTQAPSLPHTIPTSKFHIF